MVTTVEGAVARPRRAGRRASKSTARSSWSSYDALERADTHRTEHVDSSFNWGFESRWCQNEVSSPYIAPGLSTSRRAPPHSHPTGRAGLLASRLGRAGSLAAGRSWAYLRRPHACASAHPEPFYGSSSHACFPVGPPATASRERWCSWGANAGVLTGHAEEGRHAAAGSFGHGLDHQRLRVTTGARRRQ